MHVDQDVHSKDKCQTRLVKRGAKIIPGKENSIFQWPYGEIRAFRALRTSALAISYCPKMWCRILMLYLAGLILRKSAYCHTIPLTRGRSQSDPKKNTIHIHPSSWQSSCPPSLHWDLISNVWHNSRLQTPKGTAKSLWGET